MNRLLDKASEFAIMKHGDQKDDGGLPYIFHPCGVALILSTVTNDDNLIAAAYLHDVLEDTDCTYNELYKEFGRDIADLVREVTKVVPSDKSKPAYFPNLKTQRGIILKFADRLHNISRMQSWSQKKKQWYLHTSKFWKSELT
ncbi:MAG: HD domain-containing protein [Nitrosotalea sp.]